ncbi:MAG: lysophospholipase [Acetobacteraceae bacterium]|nr:lysophospholipase [Acetobacteraceae bacterium]MSP30030.1 lysophospholipase [Acetobacteraceae bacterium]
MDNTIWATAWLGAAHGPYPAGNPSAQPDQSFAFPDPATGARDQSFRLILRPDIWGKAARLRFSNVMGSRPLTIDGAYAGLQESGSGVAPGTNQPVRFNGANSITIAAGNMAWSDPVALPFVDDGENILLRGHRLAVSFHVAGASGPMTWHAKALATSYVTPPGAGSHGATEHGTAFPLTTASWFFLDAVDMRAAPGTRVIVCLGDSITDGTLAAMNADDRWPDVLARRLHARHGNRVAVVNAGIGGNQVASPARHDIANPLNGGASALERLHRDVLDLASVAAVIWFEGINDLGISGSEPEPVIAGLREGVARIRAAIPGVRIIGATITSTIGAQRHHGHPVVETRRQAINEFLRATTIFDAVADFDAVTRDPATGELRAEMQPDGVIGGEGDKVHPNHAGYLAMGFAIDIDTLLA